MGTPAHAPKKCQIRSQCSSWGCSPADTRPAAGDLPQTAPKIKHGAKTPKRGRNMAQRICVLHASAPSPSPPPPSSSHPCRFNLDWAQNRGSLVDLFTLNRQAGGQNHGALYSLIYGEDLALNDCCSTRTARSERGSQAAGRTVTPARRVLTHEPPPPPRIQKT